MIADEERIRLISQKWNDMIKKELGKNVADAELSPLSSWVIDCYEGYKEIYENLLEKIQNASLDDHDLLHDCVVEIHWQLDHIKDHIKASEKGFTTLMRALARED